MTVERKKLGFEVLFDKLMSNFGKLIPVNLIFALPLCVALCGVYLLDHFLVRMAPLTLPLVFVLVSPFYPGVVVLTRNLSEGNYKGQMFRGFFKAVGENWYKFILMGILLYLASVGGYFSISGYISLGANVSWMFYIMLFFSALICLFLVFFFFCLPLMTTSFELKLRDVYKNSALSVFGQFKDCLFALLSVVVYLAVVLMPVILFFNLAGTLGVTAVKILLVAYVLLALVLLIPAQLQLVICHNIYPKMYRAVAEDKRGKEKKPDTSDNKLTAEEIEGNTDNVESLVSGDDEEYVFYNGKMIKRGLLKSLLEQKKGESKDE